MEDAAELRTALLGLRRAGGLPVAFAAVAAGGGRLRIVELSGHTTEALRGLSVASGTGLGGKAAALTRPQAVSDYRTARTISHEYDGAVAAEGLCSVLAVPVVVRRSVRAVLYGALREPLALGDRSLDAAVGAARELEQALAVGDARRRAEREAAGAARGSGPGAGGDAAARRGAAAWEGVRAAHGELRLLAQEVADPRLRERLHAVCARLAGASGGPGGSRGPGGPGGPLRDGAGTAPPPRVPAAGKAAPRPPLSPRELDVLAQVAAGATNADAARALGVRPETVKSYLRSVMRKLDAHTRLGAVVAARRTGLLP
ncbi:response regulator transcription factor [Streptomyces sp. NPDC001380]|uniref:helix-turn-helix transcriptional regulator n=1 Tax=Streptomyces sp. NPDC001380 TaxID=3364566 RepID=UPI003677E3EE